MWHLTDLKFSGTNDFQSDQLNFILTELRFATFKTV